MVVFPKSSIVFPVQPDGAFYARTLLPVQLDRAFYARTLLPV
jgi:hypothetical protein